MTIFDDIRKDREAGTPGDWVVPDQTYRRKLTVETAGGLDAIMIACPGSGGAMSYTDCVCSLDWRGTSEWDANARRIARVPRLERAILDHADWLMHEIKVCEAAGDAIGVRAYRRTLAAIAKARGEA